MKKIILSIIVLGLIIFIGIFVFQNIEKNKNNKKIVFNIEDKTENVENIEKTDKIEEEKEFERIQVKDDRVEFYDEKGKKINQIELPPDETLQIWKSYSISDNKKYVLINIFEYKGADLSQLDSESVVFEFDKKNSPSNITIYDNEGNIEWKHILYTGQNNFLISNNGKFFLARRFGEVSSPSLLISSDGKIIEFASNVASQGSRFSQDGNYLALIETGVIRLYNDNKKIMKKMFIKPAIKDNIYCHNDILKITDNKIFIKNCGKEENYNINNFK